jgi:ribonucleoside-triphosphate reductase
MFQLKLDPVRDAGKFVYHLKSLTDAGLVTLDKKTKRYGISELGQMIVSFARDLDEYVNVKRGKLYVRTSRFAIEEFHRNKIARSLVVEAGVPQEIADEIAAEAEDRLARLKTLYLTAPLIREFVNAILIEKKLEEYRHKLTRVGMPVHDVAQLVKATGEKGLDAQYVNYASAKSVLSEYALLNCLPHRLADAHLSGSIHIANLDSWILTPNEINHDFRHFLSNNIAGTPVPDTLEAALGLASQMLLAVEAEISGEQTVDFFNVFLAPYARGRKTEETTRAVYSFLSALRREGPTGNPHVGVSIGVELCVPEFLARQEAVGPNGKPVGRYEEFAHEATQLAESITEAFVLISAIRPPSSPRLLLKVRPKALLDDSARLVLEKAHELAADRSVPYFELLGDEEKSSYSSTGLRLGDEWSAHWDADCIRTGSMDTIFVNLPHIACEAKKDDEKFLSILTETIKLTVEGFKAKRKFINERLKQPLLPILSGSRGAGPYFYERNATYNLAFLGLTEAVEAHRDSRVDLVKGPADFAIGVLQDTSKLLKEISREEEMRIVASQRPGDEAVERLAELDIEQYGRPAMSHDAARGPNYYTDIPTVPLSSEMPINARMTIESKFQSILPGGHLNVICISGDSQPKALLSLTEKALSLGCKFLTYSSNYSTCTVCGQTDKGVQPKCSRCGSDRLSYFGRASSNLLPFSLWPDAKRRNVDRRFVYRVRDLSEA